MPIRADNYGQPDNTPPDAPVKRVDFVSIREVASKVETSGAAVKFCRCWKSNIFPYCDASHDEHNAASGDNVAPACLVNDLDESDRGLDRLMGKLANGSKALKPSEVMKMHQYLQSAGRVRH